MWNKSNGGISFGANNSEAMYITNAGRVGIGRTIANPPSEKLHVDGGSLRVDIGATPDSAAIFAGGGSNLHIDLDSGYSTFRNTAGDTDASGFRFKSTSNDLVTIQNDGNVQIGNSSTSVDLKVNDHKVYHEGNFVPDSSIVFSSSMLATPEEKWVSFTIPYSVGSGHSHYYYFDVYGYSDIGLMDSQLHYRVYIHVRSSNNNPKNMLNVKPLLIMDDPLGGSDEKGFEFYYTQTDNTDSKIWIKMPEDYSGLDILTHRLTEGFISTVTSNMFAETVTAPSGTTEIPIIESLRTEGTKTYIKGDVGIGTNNPDAPLHVDSGSGNLSAKFSSLDEFAYISFEDNGTSTPPLVGAQGDALRIWTNNSTRLKIDSSGTLTIKGRVTEFGEAGSGANVNGAFLSIEGNTDSGGEGSGRLFFREHNSSTAGADNYGFSIGYRGGGTSITTANGGTWTGLTQIGNGEWGFWGHDGSMTDVSKGSVIMGGDRTATRVYINPKVGIGYHDPASPLHVVGSNSGDRLIALNLTNKHINDNTQTAIRFTNSSDVDALSAELASERQSDESNDFWLKLRKDGSTTPQVITVKGATGNVGIGATSPSAKLDVAGEINFSGTRGSFVSSLSQPRIYRSGSDQGNYPFDNYGHLILQTRTDGSNRDIVFATGTDGSNLTVIAADGSLNLNSANTNKIVFNDNSSYWLATGSSENWGMYWNTQDNKIEFHGNGVKKLDIDLDSGALSTLQTISTDNDTRWYVSATDRAYTRADARDDGTESRLHWYGSTGTASKKYRQAWYDGSAYVNIDTDGGAVNFTYAGSGNSSLKVEGYSVYHAGNLTKATTSELGLVKLGTSAVQTTNPNTPTTTASRTYAVQMLSNDQLVVNVPWTDSSGNSSTPSVSTIYFNGETTTSGAPGTDGAVFRYENNFFGTSQDTLVIEKTDVNGNNPDGGIAFTNRGADGIVETAMAIKGYGDIGIGTKTPEVKLHVNGSLLVDSYANATQGGGIFFRSHSNNDYTTTSLYNMSILAYDHNNSGHADGLSINGYDGISFCTGSNTRQQRMLIDSAGSVRVSTQIYNDGWFRNTGAGEGLYHESNHNYFYSRNAKYWHITSKSDQTQGGLGFYKGHNAGNNEDNRKGFVYWDGNGFGLLDNDGSWAFRTSANEAQLFYDGSEKLNTKSTGVDVTGNLDVSEDLTVRGVTEKFQTHSNAGTTVTVNLDSNHYKLHHVLGLSANFTVSITNLGVSDGEATNISLMVQQGSTAYIPTTLNISFDSSTPNPVTIKWQGGSEPSGTASGIDIFSFTIINPVGSGGYTALGNMVSFS
jgi:hypothetical protein